MAELLEAERSGTCGLIGRDRYGKKCEAALWSRRDPDLCGVRAGSGET